VDRAQFPEPKGTLQLHVLSSRVLRGRLIQGFRSLLRQNESGFLDECASKSFPPFRVVLVDFAASYLVDMDTKAIVVPTENCPGLLCHSKFRQDFPSISLATRSNIGSKRLAQFRSVADPHSRFGSERKPSGINATLARRCLPGAPLFFIRWLQRDSSVPASLVKHGKGRLRDDYKNLTYFDAEPPYKRAA
jgi:hypothetical protein